MSTGYPDYARISDASGFSLYETNVTPPENTTLFQGYVGSWSYINFICSVNNTTDVAQVIFEWFSDNTFTTIVGFRYVIRAGASFANTQYANLTSWCRVYYVSNSGNPFPFTMFGLYATTGPADQFQLASMDVPIFRVVQSIAATTTVNFIPQHIQPGPAKIMMQTVGTNWTLNVSYLDFATNTYLLFMQYNSADYTGKVVEDLPMIDAPYRFSIDNLASSAVTFVLAYLSA